MNAPTIKGATTARERGEVLHQAETWRVEKLSGRVYIAEVWDSFTLAVMAAILDAAWADPEWRQPWGLVIVLEATASYEPDLRRHSMPPNHKRSVGTAIVSQSLMHRMVVSSIGIGMRIANGFHLTAHADPQEGIDDQRRIVASLEAAGRPY